MVYMRRAISIKEAVGYILNSQIPVPTAKELRGVMNMVAIIFMGWIAIALIIIAIKHIVKKLKNRNYGGNK